MNAQTILVGLGAILILAGILGGGLTLKEFKIPKLTTTTRLIAVLIGAGIVGLALRPEMVPNPGGNTNLVGPPGPAKPPTPGAEGLEEARERLQKEQEHQAERARVQREQEERAALQRRQEEQDQRAREIGSVNQTKPPQPPQPLEISVSAPRSVAVGERATIVVTVTAGARPVPSASVEVSAGGGRFLPNADTPYDPQARLHGPYSAKGTTDGRGRFTTWWVVNPAAAAYVCQVHAMADGYEGGRAEYSIAIR